MLINVYNFSKDFVCSVLKMCDLYLLYDEC
jgi:hypothetical protein